ncbi:MAG: Ig-like domain-containing protein [Anaerolineae bacterium]|nr:Ig-like domain-containing protein [Anaerolineae bacterium]
MPKTNLPLTLTPLLICLILVGCSLQTTSVTPPPTVDEISEVTQESLPQAEATPTQSIATPTRSAPPPILPTTLPTTIPTVTTPTKPAPLTVLPTIPAQDQILAVISVQPAPDATGILPDTAVTVSFNRPVVALTAIENANRLPHPLTFEPPVAGAGQWLDTSTYQFTPDSAGFRRASEYTARVEKGLSDALGETTLTDNFEWRFTTIMPTPTPTPMPTPTPVPLEVSRIFPEPGERDVSPNPAIQLVFSHPMHRRNVQGNFSLVHVKSGTTVSGQFTWQANPERVTFIPNAPLEPGAVYRTNLPKGTEGEFGQARTQRDFSATFTVAPIPAIVTVRPRPGTTTVEPDEAVEITFNTPMNPGSFVISETLFITPTVPITHVYTYWSRNDTELSINFPLEYSQPYTLTLSPAIAGRHDQPLGAVKTFTWTTKARPARFSIESLGQVATYNGYTPSIVLVTARNVSHINFELYRLPAKDFINFNNDNWKQIWERYKPHHNNLLHAWELETKLELNESRLYRIDLGQASQMSESLSPGLYYLEASVPSGAVYPTSEWPKRANNRERQVLVVGKNNVTFKESGHEALVWVTDLQSGQPVTQTPVTFIEGQTTLGQTETNNDGVAQINYKQTHNLGEIRFAFVGDWQNPGDNFAVGINHWSRGITRYSSREGWIQNYEPRYTGHFYTHRPIYRPDEMVYFKGIIRANDDANYSLPPESAKVDVVICDGQGKEVYNRALSFNEMGTVNGEFKLAEDTGLGYYSLVANYEGQSFYEDFQVAAYRPPEFLVDVQTDRPRYVQGDAITVTVTAEFLFGQPVSNATVRWTLLSDNYFGRYTPLSAPFLEGGGYDFINDDYGGRDYAERGYGEKIADGEGVTDGTGRFTFEITADIAGKRSSQLYTIEAVVTDLNNQVVAGQTSVLIDKGDVLLGLQPERLIGRAGEEHSTRVLVVSPGGQPVANQRVDVVFSEYNRYSIQQLDPDQSYYRQQDTFYWDTIDEEVAVLTATVTTDQKGEAVANFVPQKGGIYKISAITSSVKEMLEKWDPACSICLEKCPTFFVGSSDLVETSTFVHVSGPEYINWGQRNDNYLTLAVDRKAYNAGDVAHILAAHPYSGTVQALVTLERGHLYDYFVTELKTNSEQIEIPITEKLAPNMYVSVVVVQGSMPQEGEAGGGLPSFKVGYASLPINPHEKTLQITLTPDKTPGETYRPRDPVTYQVKVTNVKDQPVKAELSLALVDKAVLALAPETPGQLLQQFWYRRNLGVQTASGLTLAIDRFNQDLILMEEGGKGGGGGGEPGLGVEFTRQDFAKTALWLADFTTDENGQGAIEAKLPDTLTTWTLTGIGVTGASTLVGESTVDIVSSKPLLVRPVIPRFFVVGDEAQLGLIVQNNTGQELAVDTSFEADGLKIGQARLGDGPWEKDVSIITLEDGQRVKVEYQVTVEKVAAAKLTMSARGGEFYDAVALELPVYRSSTPETVATSGVLAEDGTHAEVINLPQRFDPTQGDLTISLDASLAAGMQDGLDYLEHFPYECTEQTVSRFLPNVVTYRAYQALNLDNPALAEKLPGLVSEGLQRLYKHHHLDGGWGWWINDESNPYLTAYVLQGLIAAQQAGFEVNQDVIDAGLRYLKDNLTAPKDIQSSWQANQQASMLYVLADAGEGDLGRTVALFDQQREQLDLFGRAYLAMALHRLDENAPQLDTLLNDLNSAAVVSGTSAHWEETRPDYRAMNTDIRSTAIIIAALSRLQPDHPLLPKAVRWLMIARQHGGYWRTTQETAWAIIGLTDWMVATGELEGHYTWQVSLNDESLGQGTVTPGNIDETIKLRVVVGDLLADTANRLVIERTPPIPPTNGGEIKEGSSPGRLYYAAHLTYYKPTQEVRALDRGIRVSRQYRHLTASEEEGLEEGLIKEVKLGDVIEVKLTLVAPNALHYVVVEDPLPAGTEAIDPSLATTSMADQPSTNGHWWFTHTELRDDKAVLFATYLPQGVYEYTYLIRATLPGEYQIRPTHAEEMYFPEVFGRSNGEVFRIRE